MALGFFSNDDVLTPETIERRRKVAESLIQSGSDYSPIKSPWQGLARIAQTISGKIQDGRLNDAEKANQTYQRDKIASLLGLGGASGASSDGPTSLPGATAPAQAGSSGQPAPGFGDAIAGIESGGKYDAMGPTTKAGDRAYGKYQIMGNNIGPWSQAALGRPVTPQEFLANPQLQDQIFNSKFGEYVKKYGPEGAARAWFAGEGGMNNPNATDQLGTKVADYGKRFMAGLGQGGAVPPAVAPAAAPNGRQAIAQAMIQNQQQPQQAMPGGAMAYTAAGQPVPTDAQGNALNPDGTPTASMPQQMAMRAAPAAGMPQAGAPVPPQPIPAAGPSPAGSTPAAQPSQAGPAPVQMAQAAPQPQQGGLTGRAAIAAAMLGDPRLDATSKSLALSIVNQQLNPAAQFDFQTVGDQLYRVNKKTGDYTPLGVTAAKPMALGDGQRLVDPSTGRVIAGADPKPMALSEGQSLVDPRTGQPIGNNTQQSKIARETAERQQQAVQQGLDPKDSRTKQFILTGTYPKEADLTSTDKKAILEADEMVSSNRSTIEALKKASELSKQAYGNPIGNAAAPILSSVFGVEGAQKTQELNQVVTEQALSGLRSIFGGNPTEGERKILLEIQGSGSMPDAVRQKVYQRATEAAQRRLVFNEQKAAQMRGGDYYKPGGSPAPMPAGAPAGGQATQQPIRRKFNPATGMIE